MPGRIGGRRQLRQLQGISLELPGVAAFFFGEGDSHLPRQTAAPAVHAGDMSGEEHLRAADRHAAQQSRVDALANDVFRTAAGTAESLASGGDGHDDAFRFDPFTVGDFVATNAEDVVQHPVGHVRSPV